jgi:glycosyltransferase involved in cell wall biosynthesis
MRRWALSRYDHILCVSNAVVDGFGLSGYDGANVRTHYLGLLGDRERSRALRQSYRAEFGIPADSPVLATLAFDAPVKGVDVLLKAFADVCRQMAGCHLIIIGIEEERSALPGLAKDLGIAPNVHWAGIRDNGWQLLNAADVYVQPSRSEGLPFAMMEAMAMRLPVVGTRVGGIPEAVVDGVTGRVVPPEDPEALGCAIFDVLKNPHTWAALGDAGRGHYLEHFHGERSVKRILQSYCGLDPVTGIGNL